MSDPNSARAHAGGSLKMGGVLFLAIFGIVGLFVWVLNGPLLYATDDLTAGGRVEAPVPDPEHPTHRQFSISYEQCSGITETINLGPETLDKKAPKKLIEIRECFEQLKPGQPVMVYIETRRSRVSGQRSWRLKRIGDCAFPHLPSRIDGRSKTPCPWM